MKIKKLPIAMGMLVLTAMMMLADPAFASGASGELPPPPQTPIMTLLGIIWAAIILIALVVFILKKLE